MIICGNCGENIHMDDNFCPKCGAMININQNDEGNSKYYHYPFQQEQVENQYHKEGFFKGKFEKLNFLRRSKEQKQTDQLLNKIPYQQSQSQMPSPQQQGQTPSPQQQGQTPSPQQQGQKPTQQQQGQIPIQQQQGQIPIQQQQGKIPIQQQQGQKPTQQQQGQKPTQQQQGQIPIQQQQGQIPIQQQQGQIPIQQQQGQIPTQQQQGQIPTQQQQGQPQISSQIIGSFMLPDQSIISINQDQKQFGRQDFLRNVLEDNLKYISRNHFNISYKNGMYYIEDTISAGGTKLNGNEIKNLGEFQLNNSDKILLADSLEIIFKL